MILHIDSDGQDHWLFINGVQIEISSAKARELFIALGVSKQVDQPEPGYYRYFYS